MMFVTCGVTGVTSGAAAVVFSPAYAIMKTRAGPAVCLRESRHMEVYYEQEL